jgi:lysophospholipase L1-like esterase
MLRAGVGQLADVIVFKFCYSDITARTDSAWLFRSYDRTIRALRETYRGATFVHVTTPLTTVRAGALASVNGLLRRVPDALADNARREEFNGLMRRAYAGSEPLFDLAGAESVTPSGRRELHGLHGRPIAALAPGYTSDGGHLNVVGRARMARELVALLASLVERA